MNKTIYTKRNIALLTGCAVFASMFSLLGNFNQTQATTNYDYLTALNYATQFYDANKCGQDAGTNNVFNWRDACHVNDGQDVGLDLSGGYHDAGDHVKFGITQGYTASILGWSLYEYKDGFDKAGSTEKILQTLKHFTDYLLKSHPNPNVFYYQVGDGNIDHSYWGAPEAQGDRSTIFKVDANHSGSDVAGEASAALSLMYLNYKDIDPAYANRCLSAAKTLYSLAKVKPGTSQGQGFYTSTSYKDDLAWAATWLYQITGDSAYLKDAENYIKTSTGVAKDEWTMCWDNMLSPATIQLYKLTNKSIYLDAVKHNLNYWYNSVPTTPGGLKYLTNWGVLRYSAAQSMIALQYYNLTGDKSAKSLATSQINYILGNNPNHMSYIVGYGSKYPLHPHHRAANGYTYANGGNLKPAKHILTGALVGGPNSNDQYNDNGNDYIYTEVGIDYNAGLVGALAGLASNQDSSVPVLTPTLPPTSTSVPTPTPAPVLPSTSVEGAIPKVSVTTQLGSSVNQQYTISSVGSQNLDLSKLAIRYYYSKSGAKSQSFWCDHAGLQLNVFPWYVNLSSEVKGTFKDNYLEITFDTTHSMAPNSGSLNLGIRFAQSDWSNYEDLVDKGYEVYYNGTLIKKF